jgi:hypothetical protein
LPKSRQNRALLRTFGVLSQSFVLKLSGFCYRS